MSKSWKRSQREALGMNTPTTEREYDLLVVLADIVDATPVGQRTAAMLALLAEVRAAQAAHPEGGGQ
jgi:hypothetical protein